jgi:hypothetical protein
LEHYRVLSYVYIYRDINLRDSYRIPYIHRTTLRGGPVFYRYPYITSSYIQIGYIGIPIGRSVPTDTEESMKRLYRDQSDDLRPHRPLEYKRPKDRLRRDIEESIDIMEEIRREVGDGR